MTAIQVLVGLAALYSVLSIACSALQETLAGFFERRGKNLRETVTALFGGTGAAASVTALFKHPLIRGCKFETKDPTWIEPKAFAEAVLDLASPAAPLANARAALDVESEGHALPAIADLVQTVARAVGNQEAAPVAPIGVPAVTSPTGSALAPPAPSPIALLNSSIDPVRARLETVFGAAVDAMKAAYARRTKLWLFLIGTVVAGVVNADTLRITRELSRDPAAASAAADVAFKLAEAQAKGAVAAPAPASGTGAPTPSIFGELDANAKALNATGLRLGWDGIKAPEGVGMFFWFIGILITGCALSMGGPFWFDLLSKLMSKRPGT